MNLHPLCTLFPRMDGAEFAALVADISANGQREPIITHDGMILDGGNRHRACAEAGVEPITKPFDGGNIVSYVLSANLHRRHMTPGQQAAIVASAQDWAEAQPPGSGGDRRSSATLHLIGASERAAQSGASLRTQKMADKVLRSDPEAAKAVGRGEVSLPAALRKIEGKPDSVDGGATTSELLDDLHADVRKAEDRASAAEAISRELEDAMRGDDDKAKIATLIRRCEHAERRVSELMEASAQLQKARDFYMRQLARVGKAIGQADLDKVAAAVEAIVRKKEAV